jgi:hypothetical protein
VVTFPVLHEKSTTAHGSGGSPVLTTVTFEALASPGVHFMPGFPAGTDEFADPARSYT